MFGEEEVVVGHLGEAMSETLTPLSTEIVVNELKEQGFMSIPEGASVGVDILTDKNEYKFVAEARKGFDAVPALSWDRQPDKSLHLGLTSPRMREISAAKREGGYAGKISQYIADSGGERLRLAADFLDNITTDQDLTTMRQYINEGRMPGFEVTVKLDLPIELRSAK